MIAARVTFIGDPTMGRTAAPTAGIRVRRAARIGVPAILCPPVTIGEEAVVGAAALVRADVPPRTVVAGAPAVPLRAVNDHELLEVWGHDGFETAFDLTTSDGSRSGAQGDLGSG